MRKRILFYSTFFVVLIVAFLYFVYKDEDLSRSLLPVINADVQNFSFINQNGKTITENNVEGKVYVAEYFFTTCKGICPKMNANMKTIYDKYKNEPDFAIISHTSMPETDSVPLLKAYAQTLEADSSKWFFVTGNKDSLYKMARESYLLDNEKNNSMNIQDQFIHTQFFAVVDKEGRVRGIYDGLKKDELEKLSTDIKNLLKETKSRTGFNNSTFSNNPG